MYASVTERIISVEINVDRDICTPISAAPM